MSNAIDRSKIYKGDIFYQYINEEIYIARVIRCKSTEKFVLRGSDKREFSLTRKQISDEWSRLKNNAYVSFYIVKLAGDAKDVVVTVNRREDLDNGIAQPYAICRQQVSNLFNEILIKDNIYHLGMSVSRDTCPPDSKFEDAFACNGLEEGETISIYLDDTLESMLKLIKMDKYDAVLKGIYKDINHRITEGACESLKELLEYHDFMYDFYLGNGIARVPFEVINNSLDIEQILYLEHLNKHVLIEPMVVPYDIDMDLSKIERAHIRIIDINKNIYIISYLEGEYVNRYFKDNIKDKRDAVCMLKFTMQKNKSKK